jgi:hypothetical protein
MEMLRMAMIRCTTLPHYDIRFNNISDEGLYKMCGYLEEATHVTNIEVSERVGREALEQFKEKLTMNKPKKGKKGKKKK